MRGTVISTLNNKIIFKTKGGKKIKWTSIPHLEVGEEVFFFTNKKGDVIKVEAVKCAHHLDEPIESCIDNINHINYSELDSEHDEVG